MRIYRASRSKRSSKEAIIKLSNYGIARVIEIGDDYILEEHVVFQHIPPSLEQMASLLKHINSETDDKNQPLVHGDFGAHNTTLIEDRPYCYDYEYAHFGNTFADIGRVLLRACKEIQDMTMFFEVYSGTMPNIETLRDGLIYFCEWQNGLRTEKNLPFQEVPLIRRDRIRRCGNNLAQIFDAFKQEVKL